MPYRQTSYSLPSVKRDAFLSSLERDISDLKHVLRSVWLGRFTSGAEWWTGYGELWSARLLCSFMKAEYGEDVDWVDARDILVVSDCPSGVIPDMDATGTNFNAYLEQHERTKIIIITGGFYESFRN
jgi:aspartokinase